MEKDKTLLLFTGEFPYGKKGEPFLEDEIYFLSNEFTSIFVFPRIKSDIIRPLPDNVFIKDDLIIPSFKILSQPFKSILKFLFTIITELLKTKKGYRYFAGFRHFLYIYLEAEILAQKLQSYLKATNLNNPLLYFYWSDTTLLAFSLLKDKNISYKIICRAHGFDLYDNRNPGKIIPFRTLMYKKVNAIYCISNHGRKYLQNKLAKKFHYKIKLAYLGVKKTTEFINQQIPEPPIIVTCARMETFKRISLMPEILKLINVPLHWVHFGDGPEFEKVKEDIKYTPSHIKVTLYGQVNNSKIHQFYKEIKIELLVSLSTSEGLPVSMMEAISYGIPILSTSINGTPEIVTSETGVLITENTSNITIAKTIESIIKNKPFNNEKIKSFYDSNFNAEINYSKFSKEIAQCI